MIELSRHQAARSTATEETAVRPAPLRRDTGIWSADENERELAAALEKVLALKPVARIPNAVFVRGSKDANHNDEFQRPIGEDPADSDDDQNLGFSWQQHAEDGEPAPGAARNDTSLQWLNKARSDRRRRMARNVMGWTISLAAGVGMLLGAAYFLIGWRPDFAGLMAATQKLWF